MRAHEQSRRSARSSASRAPSHTAAPASNGHGATDSHRRHRSRHASRGQRGHQRRHAAAHPDQHFLEHKRSFRRHVWRASSRRCVYCGDALELAVLTVDHVVPRIQGGPTTLLNCVAACFDCNQAKGALSLSEFIMQVPEAGHHFLRLAHVVHRHLRRSARRAVSLAYATRDAGVIAETCELPLEPRPSHATDTDPRSATTNPVMVVPMRPLLADVVRPATVATDPGDRVLATPSSPRQRHHRRSEAAVA